METIEIWLAGMPVAILLTILLGYLWHRSFDPERRGGPSPKVPFRPAANAVDAGLFAAILTMSLLFTVLWPAVIAVMLLLGCFAAVWQIVAKRKRRSDADVSSEDVFL